MMRCDLAGTDKLRVLFVNDEPSVLEGIKVQLRKERNRWDVDFAESGEAGLGVLELRPFDVVVSDVRMPRMDGGEFLRQVKNRFPSIVRIALSGYSDRATLLRVSSVSHQFLAQPCDGPTLKASISHARSLVDRLQAPAIRDWVGSLSALPPAPTAYLELTRLAASPSAGMDEFSRVVESDAGLTVKILQLVNSAYFGSSAPRQVSSIQQAVTMLGGELVRTLAMSAHVFGSPTSTDDGQAQSAALLAARLARSFMASTPARADEAFTAALLHDLGELILAKCAAQPSPSHSDVGAYVLDLWGLPQSLVEIVALHHSPHEISEANGDVLAAVHVADVVTGRQQLDAMFVASRARVDLRDWLSIAARDFSARPELWAQVQLNGPTLPAA